ncbi:MAG: sugar transporter substrate-binding protein [Proteobacteria bacterium]|nr:sugar transporter substrate-binding protein [Pseudomonadota bacterium]
MYGKLLLQAALGASLCALASTAYAEGGYDQGNLIKPIDKTLEIVFIPKVIHPWYDVVEQGAKASVAEFDKLGIKVNVRFDAPPTADINEHIKKIENNSAVHPDGLAVACLDPATDTQAINDAINAGIKVATFDTDCPDSKRIMYVGHNMDEQDGYDLGKFLAERVGGKGKVGILAGSLSAPNHKARVEGFKKAIAEYPDMSVAFDRPDNDNLQAAVDLTENALQSNPDLVGMFGSNASAPVGAARAIETAGLVGKVHVVGMDDLPEAIDYVKKGVIDGQKAQRQWEIGYWTVKYFVAMAQGHTFPKAHATGSQLITADSLK